MKGQLRPPAGRFRSCQVGSPADRMESPSSHPAAGDLLGPRERVSIGGQRAGGLHSHRSFQFSPPGSLLQRGPGRSQGACGPVGFRLCQPVLPPRKPAVTSPKGSFLSDCRGSPPCCPAQQCIHPSFLPVDSTSSHHLTFCAVGLVGKAKLAGPFTHLGREQVRCVLLPWRAACRGTGSARTTPVTAGQPSRWTGQGRARAQSSGEQLPWC